jgi:serine/threonine protein kinase
MTPMPSLMYEQLRVIRRLYAHGNTILTMMALPDGRQIVTKQLSTPLLAVRTRAQFRHKFSIVHTLSHPHVAPIYGGWIRLPGQCIIATEYYPRGSLYDAISPGERRIWSLPLLPSVALRLVEEIAAGLEAIHNAGIAHGGLKLSNIMLAPGQDNDYHAAISDILLHKGLVGDSNHHGNIIDLANPLLYRAPEQKNYQSTISSDVYALGIIAFVLLTGESPFAQSPAIIARLPTIPAIRRASELNPILPPTIDSILDRALNSYPKMRYRQPGAFAQALRAGGPSPDTVRAIRLPTGSIPIIGPSQSKQPKLHPHEEMVAPTPLAILGTGDLPPDIPPPPSNYRWAPSIIATLPRVEPQPKLPSAKPQHTLVRSRFDHILRLAMGITTLLIVLVFILMVLSMVARH